MENWLQPFLETLHISFFVMIVMMLMEYVELYRMRRQRENGLLSAAGKRKRGAYFLQLVSAGLLGLIPGCVGGFMVVSLYAHRMLSFGAVLAASFTALGDDAFRMLAMDPLATLRLEGLLFVSGIAVGLLTDLTFGKRIEQRMHACKIELHEPDRHVHDCPQSERKTKGVCLKGLFSSWSFSKVLLLVLVGLYMVGMSGGLHLHSHEGHLHTEACPHGISFDFEHLLFLGLSAIAFLCILFSDEHFLEEHLWKHLLKKHFPAIFLWTAGTLYLIGFLTGHFDMAKWLSGDISRMGIILAAAILIGWIPQSGPHFLFIQLYYSGAVPFVVFLANAIVQDGHTSLLLLAESRPSYVVLKTVKSLFAAVVCGILLWCI